MSIEKYYTYIYLDPRKSGDFVYRRGVDEIYCFNNELMYVGKGSDDRINKHIGLALNSNKNKTFYNVIRKIFEAGLEPIRFKILQNVSEEKAFAEEINLISIAGRRDKGLGSLCNETDGGDGNIKWTEEQKIEKSKNTKAYYESEEGLNQAKIHSKFMKVRLESPKERYKAGNGNRGRINPKKERETKRLSGLKAWENNEERRQNQVDRQTGIKRGIYKKREPNSPEALQIKENLKCGASKVWKKRGKERDILNPIIEFICEYCEKRVVNMRAVEIEDRLEKFGGFICKTKNGCAQKRTANKNKIYK